jgi:hypothetical protein
MMKPKPIIADTPLRARADGGCDINLQAGRFIRSGDAFDKHRGYLVAIWFADSMAKNLFTPQEAGIVAAALLPSGGEAARLAAMLARKAIHIDKLNQAWIAAGRQPIPLDEMPGGHA